MRAEAADNIQTSLGRNAVEETMAHHTPIAYIGRLSELPTCKLFGEASKHQEGDGDEL